MSATPMSDDDDGHPRVLVSNRQPAVFDEPSLAALAAETLAAEGHEHVELSLSFVDEDEIADLHERYMHEPGSTDVLSFALDDSDVDERGVRVLGDVVIAPAVAARNNPHDLEAELRLLVVHGVLHVLGYDHETGAERAEMWARQERYSGVTLP
ncbi:MAG: rRNA maturation RNase YbeY [Actinomycetota bacterium]